MFKNTFTWFVIMFTKNMYDDSKYTYYKDPKTDHLRHQNLYTIDLKRGTYRHHCNFESFLEK